MNINILMSPVVAASLMPERLRKYLDPIVVEGRLTIITPLQGIHQPATLIRYYFEAGALIKSGDDFVVIPTHNIAGIFVEGEKPTGKQSREDLLEALEELNGEQGNVTIESAE